MRIEPGTFRSWSKWQTNMPLSSLYICCSLILNNPGTNGLIFSFPKIATSSWENLRSKKKLQENILTSLFVCLFFVRKLFYIIKWASLGSSSWKVSFSVKLKWAMLFVFSGSCLYFLLLYHSHSQPSSYTVKKLFSFVRKYSIL